MQIFISKDNRQWGPYDAKQVSFLMEKGSFVLQDWAWVEGSPEWIPLSQILVAFQHERDIAEEETHQKVEVAKGEWRSKLTSPVSGAHQPEVMAQADHLRPTKSATVGGSWWKRNFFFPAIGLGITLFVVMLVFGAPADVADFNSLINEGGIAYEPDSEKPFDGKAVSYYPSGRLMYEAEYKDGKQHGKIISFYENGSKESEGGMESGVFHGNFIHYYPNGQKQSQYNYRHGNAISRDNWDETGKVVARGK